MVVLIDSAGLVPRFFVPPASRSGGALKYTG